MGNQPFGPAAGAFKREFLPPVDAPRRISRETANRLFIGMMRDQARFGVQRSLLGSRMAMMLVDFRDALGPRIGRR